LTYTVDTRDSARLKFSPANIIEEVLQNVTVLMGTIQATVPLDRNLGFPGDSVDRPVPVREAIIIMGLNSVISDFEPRAEIIDTEIKYESGRLQIRAEVRIDE